MDIVAALADLNAAMPLYRFNILWQKANEGLRRWEPHCLVHCKRGAPKALSLLRQGREIRVMEGVNAVRE